ncbi:hypothetical protein QBC46DRAFT_253697 [Diplogelasinospora grovesii]|uniref:DH domain-containing protein n=1 Tax=Diplogelasinospora grovesii TaxID=303347 RepID=A0AAN6ND55_9PEZI|nr:hypothetical protein QBC46DRAFT_253697 [Diplogelasinospora grovesii]
MDEGNHEEEASSSRFHPRSPPLAPGPYYDHHDQNRHYQHQQQHQYGYLDESISPTTTQASFEARPSQIPIATYAAANLQAYAANGRSDDVPASPVDPDDFYRNYRGVQTGNVAGLVHSPTTSTEAMAPANPGIRQTTSVRSNGNGAAPKPSAVPAAGRSALRAGLRSTSNPVDDRSAASGAKPSSSTSTYPPSVKDLKKKFDQTSTSQSGSTTRKAVASRSMSTRDTGSSGAGGRPPGVGGGVTSYSSLRLTATRDTGHETSRGAGTRGTQRPKYVAEDQLSTNTQSFASRISKPRNAISTNPQASKSMTHLSPSTSPRLPTSPPPLPSVSNSLLFGEILPEDNDSATAGFGIEPVRPRRTSESSVQKPHPRSFSDPDIEPSSPTDWYRGATGSGQQETHHDAPRATKNHSRAQSDLAGSKQSTTHHRHGHGVRKQSSDIPPISPTSRLPILMKKTNTPSNHGSPISTRSNSPTAMRYATAGGRSSRQHISSASRAKTPTSRAKTPTHTHTHTASSTSSRKPPPSNIATTSNGRLNAYVSAPTPKLSPTLRSSRPRQSVATATTAASRMKAVDTPSPHRVSQRSVSKPEDSATRRRKISVGPIDFAQRRETIKLAYSKSIRETQATEARQAAADKRKKELEAVARAKAEAEAAAAASAAVAAAAAAAAATTAVPTAVASPVPAPTPMPTQRERTKPDEPLKITTDLSLLKPSIKEAISHLDSPTLGIPGSFPRLASPALEQEEIPQSAISTTTAITEFDPDEQTEPPKPENTAAIDHDLGITVPVHAQLPNQAEATEHVAPTLYKRASYHYPFDDDDDGMDGENVSIKISLDPSAQPSPQPTPTRTDFNREQSIPGSFEDEYEPQPYTYPSPAYGTTVTILGSEPDFRPPAVERDQPPEEPTRAPDPVPIVEPLPAETSTRHASVDSQSSDAAFHEPRLELESLDCLEDFYVGPHLHDNIASLRDSRFTSSDVDIAYDGQPSSGEYQKTPDTSHNLLIPGLFAPANRMSQHSAWTDFSFGSVEDREPGTRSSILSHTKESEMGDETAAAKLKPKSSVGNLSVQGSGYGDTRQRPDISPLDTSRPMSPSLLADSLLSPQLPEIDTGEGFAVPYLPQAVGVPMLPDHAPPPPPMGDYDLDDSAYLAGTRPSSYLHQEDECDDLTLHSVEHLSLDTPEPPSATQAEHKPPSPEAQGSIEKEQKRLRQRLMVIRELIDTEDTFVRDMNVVEEIYKGTAEACPNLDSKTVKLIFRNTDEIIAFHTAFLAQLKAGVSSIYTPRGRRSPLFAQDSNKDSDSATLNSMQSGNTSSRSELDDEKDRQTSVGPLFTKNIEQLKAAHEIYLRSSDQSSKRLLQIQEEKAVKMWLAECNEEAKDLTSAWNLDSLLIKPMQRITKYPDIITHLLKYTPDDHPDREALISARSSVISTIDDINKAKKNFELVGQIVSNRKRKDSDVRAGLARAFGKRVDKLQTGNGKTAEDEEFLKLHEKFGDDYLRLQVVLRDVEYYTRTVTNYVHEFLQYLSSMELVMRLQPSRDYAHIESKWVQFNVSMRDIEKVALEKHLSDVRKHVIEPFEQVIRCYGNPALAMKKRAKRRLDYEKYLQLKANGKKIDKQLSDLVEQYEALNDTLRVELPKLSDLTAKVGNICLGKFVSIQASWYGIWKEKVKSPLQDIPHVPEVAEIVSAFEREFNLQEERAMAIGILNPAMKGRTSQSTTDDASSILSRTRSRPGDLLTPRGRGLSVNSDYVPSLPTPEFATRNSGQFSLSPTANLPSPGHYYRDYYSGITNGHARGGSNSPNAPDPSSSSVTGSRSAAVAMAARPNTGRSYDSSVFPPRQSSDIPSAQVYGQYEWRDSHSTYNSNHQATETRRLSGLFHSALPLPDGPEEGQRSSRTSSRERPANSGYTILWLAASLFEFNIETVKHEAGYPYLTYQAGEIFDVIGEKGELWLAKNQDDPRDQVGWIWSKHFAKLADS